MRDNIYKLIGTVCVPEEEKEEFNQLILQLLDHAGIRNTKRVSIAGREVVTVEQPHPDVYGIVRFDCSIFEKKIRKEGTYDMQSCALVAPDREYNAYELVMNMIMNAQEAYSDGACYMTKNGKLCSTVAYAATIKSLLSVTLDFPGRARLWDMCLFLRENGCEMKFKTLIDFYWAGYNAVLDEHLEGMMAAENLWGEPDTLSMSREQIRKSSAKERRDCAVQVMKNIMEKEQKD